MKLLFTCIFAAGLLSQVAGAQPFTGVITDSGCADADHSRMRMGDTDAECVLACVDAHGSPFVLFDGKVTYELSDQKAPSAFAGKKVTVTGTLDAKTRTIHVESIVAAQ